MDREFDGNDEHEHDGRFGRSFRCSVQTGNLNGDRFGDLAIGVPGQTVADSSQSVNPASGAGAVSVLYGAAASSTNTVAGLTTTNSQIWDQAISGMVGDGVDNNEAFGKALRSAISMAII